MPHRTLCRVLAVAVLATLTQIISIAPSEAAIAAPRGLSPSHKTVSGVPVLAWKSVRGATRYDVQLDTSKDFSTPIYALGTTSRHATPTATLPSGTLYLRVRAISDTKGTIGRWATTWFKESAFGAPQPQAPANGATLSQPTEPPVLVWQPVRNAVNYTVQVDTDDQFIQPFEYGSATESFLFPLARPSEQYSWRVRANFAGGFISGWSSVRKFSVDGLPAPALRSPANNPNDSIADAVLDWDPVPGAVAYDLRIGTDDQFNTITEQVTVKSTRWASPNTYNNDQYWWQVRSVDVKGDRAPWSDSPVWQLRRAWSDPVLLTYPADGDMVGDPFFYQWAPVRHASWYRIDVGTDPNFSPNTYGSCTTVQTTYTPRADGTGCSPTASTVTYWRVRAFDGPTNVNSLYSSTRSFIYDKTMVNQLTPLEGDTVDVPTMTWEAANDAVKYEVIVKNSTGAIVASVQTHSLSWTPNRLLNAADGPFHWTVAAIDGNGQRSATMIFGFDRTFSLSGVVPDGPAANLTALTPATDEHSTRFPSLSWEPYVSGGTPADHYQVWVGPYGGNTFGSVDTYSYSAGTDITPTYFSPGRYKWFVQAFDANNILLSSGSIHTFYVDNLLTVAGQRLSLSGTGSADPATSCDRGLNDPPGSPTLCGNLQQTPILRWGPVPQAGYYMVYLSHDREMTNPIGTVTTQNTMWTPTDMLPDSQAGDAYYWFVRPCKLSGYCAPEPSSASNAFDKRSNPINGLLEYEHESSTPLPAHGPAGSTDPTPFADEVVLSWSDYLDTNAAGNAVDSTHAVSTVEATSYHVQIASDPNFTQVLVDSFVDQTSFSPAGNTLPEGPVYWRVQAIDGSGNRLTWSDRRVVNLQKKSPTPHLVYPASDGKVTGAIQFRWDPQSYARSYELQVARKNDATFSPANLVINGSTDYPTFTPTNPLPAATSAYLWRVRRLDADGRPGAWSPARTFVVTGQAPTLRAPGSGKKVSGKDLVFSWSPVDRAVSYRIDRRIAGESWLQESVGTVGLNWAPPYILGRGRYEWRVVGFDRAGAVVGSSSWRKLSIR